MCLFVLMFIMVYMCAMHDKGVDKLIEREWWNSRKEPGDERAGKREKKGKEGEKVV